MKGCIDCKVEWSWMDKVIRKALEEKETMHQHNNDFIDQYGNICCTCGKVFARNTHLNTKEA